MQRNTSGDEVEIGVTLRRPMLLDEALEILSFALGGEPAEELPTLLIPRLDDALNRQIRVSLGGAIGPSLISGRRVEIESCTTVRRSRWARKLYCRLGLAGTPGAPPD